jgi:hypothetical protein
MTIQKPARKPRRQPATKSKADPTLWRDLAAIGESLPKDAAARFPRDGARNLHHYLHGAPKQDSE